MFSTDDTIVAIATPPGRGGLGVVRLSGPDACRIACSLLGRSDLPPRQATLGHVVEARDGHARRVDQVVATWFEAPHSYTTEDVVEISAHGSPVLLRRIVDLATTGGARLAEPGEFTYRAYLHGRIDLVQAEAVADLIDAVTPLQARAAMDQLDGTLTGTIAGIDRALFDLVARLEASLDFPDEGFHFVTRAGTEAELGRIAGRMEALMREGGAGRVLREGSLVAIVGPPNAGKSSLFNALVGSARAIVTDVPGTTRDLVSEMVDLDGMPVTFVDTAGLRPAEDAVEAEGVRRAGEALDVAALALVVVDGSIPLEAGLDASALSTCANRVVVASKSDRGQAWAPEAHPELGAVEIVSAVTGFGLDALRRRILTALTDRDDWREPPAVSNLRHLRLIGDALAATRRAVDQVTGGASEELVLAELASAREALEAVTGRRTPDDLLHHVFSRFCIGK